MSEIETTAKRSDERTILCTMCGLQVRHIAEMNGHSICPRCFSDYLEDRFGNEQTGTRKAAPVECA